VQSCIDGCTGKKDSFPAYDTIDSRLGPLALFLAIIIIAIMPVLSTALGAAIYMDMHGHWSSATVLPQTYVYVVRDALASAPRIIEKV
jgi:hypothetical protein